MKNLLQLGLTGSWWRRIATGQRRGEFYHAMGLCEGEAVMLQMDELRGGQAFSSFIKLMFQLCEAFPKSNDRHPLICRQSF